MDSQMEFLKPATAARMNIRATNERKIRNSIPKNLYRFTFSCKLIFRPQFTFILRANLNHYTSFLGKIKAFSEGKKTGFLSLPNPVMYKRILPTFSITFLP